MKRTFHVIDKYHAKKARRIWQTIEYLLYSCHDTIILNP
jgi:hypothetical protein